LAISITISESNIEKDTKDDNLESLKCDYCEFVGIIGGLKTHIRRMHTRKANLFMCNFCTYTSKSESELETHTSKYNITHSRLDYNDHYEEVNCEIFALKQIGIFLLGMQSSIN
jgi:hypothetical protein